MGSRKHFADFANGLAARYLGRNTVIRGHWAAGVLSKKVLKAGETERTFDLLGVGDRLDCGSSAWLHNRLVATSTPRSWLASATLRVTFSLRPADPVRKRWWARLLDGSGPSYDVVATATLVDDRGRRYEASAADWC